MPKKYKVNKTRMYAHVCVGIPFNVYTHFISFHLVSFHYLTLPYPTLHYTTHIFAQTVLSNCDVERIGCAKKRFRYTCQARELETPEVEGHHRRIQEEINK